jgi:hypothetical protein
MDTATKKKFIEIDNNYIGIDSQIKHEMSRRKRLTQIKND